MRLLAALCLLAGALLAACDNGTPVPTPTAITSSGPTSTPAVAPISEVFITSTPTTAPAQASSPTPAVAHSGQTVDTSPTVTSSTPITLTGTPGTPTPTATPEVRVSDTAASVITETKVVDIDAAQWIQDSFTVSPDRKHVGYISAAGPKFVMFIDNKRSNEYIGILENTLIFSNDGKHYAFGAVKNTNYGPKGLVIIDSVEQKGRYDLLETGIVFSRDGSRLAYGATRGDKHLVIVDGKEGDEYDAVLKASIRFSPDSKHVTYVAGPDGAQFVVMDGERQKMYGDVLNLLFSPDSSHVAYLAVTAGMTATLTETALNPGSTPQPAANPAKRVLVLDGKEGKGYEGVNPASLVWSPDSKHTAYMVQDGVKQFLVMDGQEGPKYDVLGGIPEFSPDSTRVAYAACEGTCTTATDGKWRIVVQDITASGLSQERREGAQYEGIGSTIVWSPDSQYIAYVASSGGKQFVVVGRNLSADMEGLEGEHYDGIGRGTVLFSPDSKRLAYVAGANNKQFVVVDGKRGPDYESIGRGTPVFSTDGKHIAYAATANGTQSVVLDSQPGKEYDVAGKGGIVFDGPNTFYYLAIANDLNLRLGMVWLVEHRVK